MNLLLIGSDSREGQGGGFGQVSGQRSDTTMLVHLNAGRTRAAVVSIPRDLVVDIPKCGENAPRRDRFNAAFSLGGVPCTIRTVKNLTGLDVNHVIVVDFKGLKEIVNAIGGLQVCIAYPMKDEKAGLNLKKGPQVLDGKQVLALARARYNLGNGSDIDRIGRQQQILQAFVSQIKESGTLTNPVSLYGIADAALSSLSVDEGLNETGELVDLISPLQSLDAGSVEFITYPWTWSPGFATVDVDKKKASNLNQKLADDALPIQKRKPSGNEGSGNTAKDEKCMNPVG